MAVEGQTLRKTSFSRKIEGELISANGEKRGRFS